MRLPGRVLATFVLLVAGCEREDSGLDPAYREPRVDAFLYKVEYYDGSLEYSTYIEVFDEVGLRMVPVVRLNGGEVPVYYYSPSLYRYGHEEPFAVGQRYELEIDHYWGRAFSRLVMPGDFSLTAPDSDYVMGLESTLVVTWRSSPRAQWYWVDLYCDFDYYDTLLHWDDYSFNLDTLVPDTFLVVPPERVFPGYVMELIEGDGSALVWAGNGPPVEPGDVSNVRGAGFGFFSAANEPKERYFWVGAPWRAGHAPRTGPSRAKLEQRLRRSSTAR